MEYIKYAEYIEYVGHRHGVCRSCIVSRGYRVYKVY